MSRLASQAGSVRTGILVGCAGILALSVIGAGSCGYVVFRSIRASHAYRMAVEEVRRSPAAREALGEPIAEGLLVMGNVSVTGPGGEAQLAIPVSGPRGEGKLHVEAVKRAGEWTITLLKLDPPAGPRIDLLAGAQQAALERGCEGGSAADCSNLGVSYENGRGVGKDLARATALYEKACGGGHAAACGNLGSLYMGYTGVAEDAPRAASFLERGCAGGIATACSNLGVMHQRGWGVPRDLPRAAALYGKGCDGGYPLGCINLAELHVRGTGVPRDDARAAALFERACNAGDARACQRLSELSRSREDSAP